MTSQPSHCRHIGEDGSQCKAHPHGYSEYCFFHDPLMKEERAAASRDGGMMRAQRAQTALRLPAGMFTQPLDTVADLATLMKTTLEKTCRGEIDVRSGSTVAYMISILMQTMDRAEQNAEEAAYADAAESAPIANT